jgi:hypothetical protein
VQSDNNQQLMGGTGFGEEVLDAHPLRSVALSSVLLAQMEVRSVRDNSYELGKAF